MTVQEHAERIMRRMKRAEAAQDAAKLAQDAAKAAQMSLHNAIAAAADEHGEAIGIGGEPMALSAGGNK